MDYACNAMTLPILYQDDYYVAVYKPPGMLVHRTRLSDGTQFAMQTLRNQLGRYVYPIHRLDRPTAGLLLFALESEAAARAVEAFTGREVEKRYLAVVRGHVKTGDSIDHPLREEPDRPLQSAVTIYRRLATVRLDIPVGRYPEARYSLAEICPQTGRMHQIRKHMKHIFHPVVGDTTYGEGRHNRLFREHFGCHRLLLAATGLRLPHPYDGGMLDIRAEPDRELRDLFAHLGWPDTGSASARVIESRLDPVSSHAWSTSWKHAS